MSRRKRRADANKPVDLWFHGQSETERICMGLIPPPEPPKAKPAPLAFPSAIYTLVARFDRQCCSRCHNTTMNYIGLFERRDNETGTRYTASSAGDITKAKVELLPTQPIKACYHCLTGAQ